MAALLYSPCMAKKSNATPTAKTPRRKLRFLFIALVLLADVHQAAAQGERFFRISGPTATTITAFRPDGTLVWSNAQTGTNYGYSFTDAGSSKGANYPVQMVSWYDVVKWSNARSQQAGLTQVYYTDAGLTQVYTNGDVDAIYANWSANGYRLPTEAEWEKAARGGLSGQRFPWGNTISESQADYYSFPYDFSFDLGPSGYNMAFFQGGNYASSVGYFAANGYGLYDMAGNVYEWCWDRYGTPYGQPTITNPKGPQSGLERVSRGGSWACL